MMFVEGMNYRLFLWRIVLALLVATSSRVLTAQEKETTANLKIWDTSSPFTGRIDVQAKGDWKVVPVNLLMLEADPSAAMSDPSYYGREYSFKGDAVVENEYLAAVFSSKRGRVIIYSKADSGKKKVELIPLQLKGKSVSITSCRVLQNTGDEAGLEVSFSAGERAEDLSAIFSFSKKQIIEIKPAENMRGMSLLSPIEYAVVPSFIGDDLIFDPAEYTSTNTLYIPSENLFLGLLEGEKDMLVITWPKGKQAMRLVPDNKEGESRFIESVDFENDGKSIYLALLGAPGIWHEEELKPSYLEKDVTINWERPFPAKWVTQLYEAGVKTTFSFRESEQRRIWRAVIGAYVYPVWFDGGKTFYHLSKKIPPKGKSVIYFLERKGTAVSIWTPVDIMKETLGRQTCDTILDLAGRKLRTHHRRGGEGVRRASTCGCTAAIEEVFKAGKEVAKKEYIAEATDDMLYFVDRHMERINEYRNFVHNMTSFLGLRKRAKPDLKPFLDSMEAITKEMLQEYSRQRENIKSLEYAGELVRKTKALTQKKDPKNLSTFSALSKEWRKMGGAQDSLLGKYHSMTRRLFQEAGYGCVNRPEAVEIAQEIRRRCRECLRNPDGYEIWPNY